jgi:syntaxin 5
MCDRTQELLKLVQEVSINDISTGDGKKRYEVIVPKNKSTFLEAAGDIAKGIQHTSRALSTLTKLVRRQGLFDDPTEEINNLVYRIKEDLAELNTKCDTAQQYIDSQKSSYSQTKQSSNHSLKVVSQLKSDLMTATKDFKNVLEIRSSKIKDQQKRKAELTGNAGLAIAVTPMKSFQPSSSSSSSLSSNAMNMIETNGLHHRLNGFSSAPSPYHTIPLEDDDRKPNNSTAVVSFRGEGLQQHLLVAPPANLQYYESREQAVTEVEKTISELSTLFKRLAGMIAEQQELVERIDEDVESAVASADQAHSILLTMYENAASNRGLYTKIIAILVVFIIFFVLFLM